MPKISQYNPATTPLSGSETFILNQNGVTYKTSLSSIKNYTDTTVRVLSSNWQNTYTTFSTNSANYAKVNVDNNLLFFIISLNSSLCCNLDKYEAKD